LSILAYHKASGSVKGMNEINAEMHKTYDKKFGKDMDYYVPPKTMFWSFRVMTGIDALIMLVALFGLIWSRKNKYTIENKKWFLVVLGLCIWVPFIGNSAGWFITEFGRYPWIVYGLFTIAQAVSPTSTVASLLFSNIIYFWLFTLLGGVMVWYCRKTLHHGPYYEEKDSIENVDPFAKEAFEK